MTDLIYYDILQLNNWTSCHKPVHKVIKTSQTSKKNKKKRKKTRVCACTCAYKLRGYVVYATICAYMYA